MLSNIPNILIIYGKRGNCISKNILVPLLNLLTILLLMVLKEYTKLQLLKWKLLNWLFHRSIYSKYFRR